MIKLKAWNARPLIDILSPRHWHFPVLRAGLLLSFTTQNLIILGTI
jgi:hypothetical protein